MNAIAISESLYVQMGRRKYEVKSFADASEKWCAFRDASLAGVSDIGNGVNVCNEQGEKVARISYNGRIWEQGSKYF